MENKQYTLGIDIGSTTVKIAILDSAHNILFSDYKRHFANIRETLHSLLSDAYSQLGNIRLHPMITGSGGLTLANHLKVPFVQEVISVATALKEIAPKTDVAIELGGEDAKIIYFEGGNVEQRMNGICAGGTGSFIDQMASLLQTDAAGLNEYARGYKSLYTIAARCGVFAKSDIQPLINEGATKEDLAASIFQAVVNQTISGLACGKPIRGHIAFLGGPLHFLSELKAAFIRTLKLDEEHTIETEHSHLFAAIGSALNAKEEVSYTMEEMVSEWAFGKFMSLYTDFRFRRGDNTLLVYLLKGITSWLWKRNARIYNRYGYSVLKVEKERGTMDGKREKKKYYLMNAKIYAKRFSTDCFSDYFNELAKKSKTGLMDCIEYATEKATVAELKRQNSYFINSLYGR